jgi:hypothetical protein
MMAPLYRCHLNNNMCSLGCLQPLVTRSRSSHVAVMTQKAALRNERDSVETRAFPALRWFQKDPSSPLPYPQCDAPKCAEEIIWNSTHWNNASWNTSIDENEEYKNIARRLPTIVSSLSRLPKHFLLRGQADMAHAFTFFTKLPR